MRRRLLLSVLASVALAPGCLSPTLPLPPPEQPSTITAGRDPNTWDVFGSCTPGARVIVMNDKTGKGAVVDDIARSGSYHVTLVGAECDVASVREETEEGESAPTYFVLAPRKPGDPTDNPACH
jgi:hypothetical protein